MTKVKVYTTTFCPYCVSLKEFLRQKEIPYEEVNVFIDLEAQKQMVEKSGQIGVPVVEIGDEVIVGFDRERISQILNLKI